MAFQLSPGVNVSEIDLTTIVPSVASSIGAHAGIFAWGPANEIVTIGSEGLEVEFNDQRVHKMSWEELDENGS